MWQSLFGIDKIGGITEGKVWEENDFKSQWSILWYNNKKQENNFQKTEVKAWYKRRS